MTGIRPNVNVYRLPAHLAAWERRGITEAVRRWGPGILGRPHTARHNIVTTAGLNAWAYNLVNSNGQVVNRLAIGTGTTAPALGDTALATQTAIYTSIEAPYAVGSTLVVILWLIGSARDSRDGETIAESGLFTTNSGATESSNKLVCRAVFDDVIPVDTKMYTVFIWNLTVTHTTTANQVMTDFGKHFAVTRLQDLTTYNPLNRLAFGTGTTQINPRESEALASEAGRLAPGTAWARTGTNGQVQAAEVLSVGEIGGQLEEMGPAIDGTASQKTIMQDLSVSLNNTTTGGTATSTITLANV